MPFYITPRRPVIGAISSDITKRSPPWPARREAMPSNNSSPFLVSARRFSNRGLRGLTRINALVIRVHQRNPRLKFPLAGAGGAVPPRRCPVRRLRPVRRRSNLKARVPPPALHGSKIRPKKFFADPSKFVTLYQSITSPPKPLLLLRLFVRNNATNSLRVEGPLFLGPAERSDAGCFSIQHSAFSIQHSAFSIQHSAFPLLLLAARC